MAEKEGTSGIRPLIISGLAAVLVTVAGAFVKGCWDLQLAEHKFTSDLVLKALESSSQDDRKNTLNFMVASNLIRDESIRRGIRSYLDAQGDNKQPPVPQVKPTALGAPIIPNARIYLLAGRKDDTSQFSELRAELAIAGFAVVGAKYLDDTGRPVQPEVRYFNAADSVQAERIAEFMRFKLAAATLQAKQFPDANAREGYIEIWLGR